MGPLDVDARGAGAPWMAGRQSGGAGAWTPWRANRMETGLEVRGPLGLNLDTSRAGLEH
jgi:hypothetical protein